MCFRFGHLSHFSFPFFLSNFHQGTHDHVKLNVYPIGLELQFPKQNLEDLMPIF
jgi:hypothetical protein